MENNQESNEEIQERKPTMKRQAPALAKFAPRPSLSSWADTLDLLDLALTGSFDSLKNQEDLTDFQHDAIVSIVNSVRRCSATFKKPPTNYLKRKQEWKK